MIKRNYARLYQAKSRLLAETATRLREVKKSERSWRERVEEAEALSRQRLEAMQQLTTEVESLRSRFEAAERERLADEAEIAFWVEEYNGYQQRLVDERRNTAAGGSDPFLERQKRDDASTVLSQTSSASPP
jgi:chromosome segregation ATPase